MDEALTARFQLMSGHGEAIRRGGEGGTVVLSRLESGASRILGLTPSLRFVLEGEETYVIEGRARRLRAGEFMLAEGGVDAVARISGPALGLCVYFEGPVASVRERLAAPMVMGGLSEPLGRDLRALAATVARDPETGPRAAAAALEGLSSRVEGFLAGFARRRDRLWQARPAVRTEVLQRLARLRDHIHAHAGRPLTLEQLSLEAGLSPFHLTRAFAAVYGVPPLAYHRGLRLDAAADALAREEASATELARRLGYGDLSAFSRAFRARFGVPPSRYVASR